MTLVGNEVKVGDNAPDFTVLDGDLSPVACSSVKGKVCILSIVPSLDTPTCDTQTRRFNEEASALGSDVTIWTISVDLPFSQKRWCGAAGVERVETYSDYRDLSFANAYGLLIKEVRLLARAVTVVDREGKIVHFEIVKEVANEPDYSSALEAVRKLL